MDSNTNVVLSGCKTILNYNELPSYFQNKIRFDLTFNNPEYVGLVRHRKESIRWMLERGEELPPEKLLFYTVLPGGEMVVPRSYYCGMEENIVDINYCKPFTVNYNTPRLSLRDVQKAAMLSVGENKNGYFVCPTGSGKTILGLEIARTIGKRALVLTRRDHSGLKGWVKNCSKYLDMEIGIIKGEEINYKNHPITVAMVQTLWRNPDIVSEISNFFPVLIIDELQNTPAYTFNSLISRINSEYIYGLSATPERNDELTPVIGYIFGKKLFEIKLAKEVVPAKIKIVRTGVVSELLEGHYKKNYSKALAHLCAIDIRNELIINKIANAYLEGKHILVVTHRVTHAKDLCNRLAFKIGLDKVGLLVGEADENIKWECVSKEEKKYRATFRDYGIELKVELVDKMYVPMFSCSFPGAGEGGVVLPSCKTLHAAKDIAENFAIKRGSEMVKRGLISLPKIKVNKSNVGRKFKKKHVPLLMGIKHNQDEVIDLATAGELPIVISTYQYSAEGLDVPVWDTLFMATPSKNRIELKQVMGRVRRYYEGKSEAYVWDFYDACGMFNGFYIKRKRFYANLEKENRTPSGEELDL